MEFFASHDVVSPREVNADGRETEYSFPGFIPTNKQTIEQTTQYNDFDCLFFLVDSVMTFETSVALQNTRDRQEDGGGVNRGS